MMFHTIGSKQGDKFIRNDHQKQEFKRWWDSLKDGTLLKADWRIVRGSKSYKQVKTHFGLLINTIIIKANDEGIDTSAFLKLLVQEDLPTGIGLTSDFLHQLFYLLCPIYDEEGKRVSLSKMDTEQASRWLEMCRNLMASRGIYIPDPDPNWKEKEQE